LKVLNQLNVHHDRHIIIRAFNHPTNSQPN
jgi:hypothetical protein